MVVAMEARTVRPEAAPVAPPVVRQPRPESPERWQKALARAMAAGIDVLYVGGSDAYAVESQSRPGLVFLVDAAGRTCGCEAATVGDPVCLHRALVRFITNQLDAAQSECCPECSGTGRCQYWTGEGGLDAFVDLPCPRCREGL